MSNVDDILLTIRKAIAMLSVIKHRGYDIKFDIGLDNWQIFKKKMVELMITYPDPTSVKNISDLYDLSKKVISIINSIPSLNTYVNSKLPKIQPSATTITPEYFNFARNTIIELLYDIDQFF